VKHHVPRHTPIPERKHETLQILIQNGRDVASLAPVGSVIRKEDVVLAAAEDVRDAGIGKGDFHGAGEEYYVSVSGRRVQVSLGR
jgi:hypothetical protein